MSSSLDESESPSTAKANWGPGGSSGWSAAKSSSCCTAAGARGSAPKFGCAGCCPNWNGCCSCCSAASSSCCSGGGCKGCAGAGGGVCKAGFLGIVRLCALRDAAREGAANSYSEARARKVSPRITLSPPYSNKLTLKPFTRSFN